MLELKLCLKRLIFSITGLLAFNTSTPNWGLSLDFLVCLLTTTSGGTFTILHLVSESAFFAYIIFFHLKLEWLIVVDHLLCFSIFLSPVDYLSKLNFLRSEAFPNLWILFAQLKLFEQKIRISKIWFETFNFLPSRRKWSKLESAWRMLQGILNSYFLLTFLSYVLITFLSFPFFFSS